MSRIKSVCYYRKNQHGVHTMHAVLSAASKKQTADLEAFSLKLENLLAESAQGAAAPR